MAVPAADDDDTVNDFFFLSLSLSLSLNHCNVISNWEDPFFNGSPEMNWVDDRYYVYNIFTINYRWLVIIDSNLNLALRLLF